MSNQQRIKVLKQIVLPAPSTVLDPEYRSGFWNEEPSESMQEPYIPSGRLPFTIDEGSKVLRIIGEGCYAATAAQGAE